MSTQKSEKPLKEQVPSTSSNVVALDRCCFQGCKHKPSKASFCSEHFTWFKEGLITKAGEKCSDFDKKYYHYSQRKAA